MKTCPECGIAQLDEYQFCPEDGASLTPSSAVMEAETTAKATPRATSAVVLYCPACAAEYPLTFAECPVHHTALTRHGIPLRIEPQTSPQPQPKPGSVLPFHPLGASHGHPASASADTRRTSLEAYEATLESLARPAANAAEMKEELPPPARVTSNENHKYRQAAIVISFTLALLGLFGIYSVFSNATRKPTPSRSKVSRSSLDSAQPAITVQTPQAARDYQEPADAKAAPPTDQDTAKASAGNVDDEARTGAHRNPEPVNPQPSRTVVMRPLPASREQIAAPSQRPAQPVAAMRRPAATELVLPRGTYGLVDARLTSVRASRTASGYRYDLTFHMADQAGHATQWERLAITTRAASGASRQQQIPFYHRLGADGSLSFTVSVEMPGRAPGDWQGRIICTSVGSDSSGKTYRASFGANVSPN